MRRTPGVWLAALLFGALACRAGQGPGPSDGAGGAEGQAKLRLLEEILASRNDNDPRLDRDFDALSPETRRLFRKRYHELPPEQRNDRGTIVFLLGRNLVDDEDWAFLREVAAEAPCLSLADCSRKTGSGGHEAALGDEVTLAYPSLVALEQARRALEADPKGPSAARAKDVIAAARASKAPAVLRMVERLERDRAGR